jgi:hypothetical protein
VALGAIAVPLNDQYQQTDLLRFFEAFRPGSMAYSLAARVSFLDHELVELDNIELGKVITADYCSGC